MNNKFTISNLDKTLFVHILIIVITQRFINKINISNLLFTKKYKKFIHQSYQYDVARIC